MKAGNRIAATAVLAVAISIAGVTPASALPKNFFGMATLEPPAPSDLQTMSSIGVESVRLNVYWANVEPTQGARDWTYYDSLIGSMASAGLTPEPVFDGSPQWISQDSYRPPIYSAAQQSAWTRFVTDFAARYGNNGTFWAEHPTVPYRPLTYWEVWNEPSLRQRWGGPPSPSGYITLLRITRRALLQADPHAKVVFAGTFPDPFAVFGMQLTKYLKKIYAHRGARKLFDVLALHPFSATPKQLVNTCRQFRNILNKHGDRRTPLWITEMGWSTSGSDPSPYATTEAGQARDLRRVFTMLIKARRQLRLQLVDWHAWRDFSENPASAFQMGLLRVNGTPKPSFYAYQGVARR